MEGSTYKMYWNKAEMKTHMEKVTHEDYLHVLHDTFHYANYMCNRCGVVFFHLLVFCYVSVVGESYCVFHFGLVPVLFWLIPTFK